MSKRQQEFIIGFMMFLRTDVTDSGLESIKITVPEYLARVEGARGFTARVHFRIKPIHLGVVNPEEILVT